MKYFSIILLLVIVQTTPPVPRKSANDATSSPSTVAKKAEKDNEVAPPAPVQGPKNTPNTQGDGGEETSQDKNPQDLHVIVDRLPGKDGWDKFYICLTATLVAIAALTLGGILYQAVKTKEAAIATQVSAEATKKSVELQRIAMQQWIDTDEWEAGPIHIIPNATKAELPVGFQIGNLTSLPLTLNSVTIWVDRRWHCTVAFGQLLLAPQDWTCVRIPPITLEGERLNLYRARNLAFEIGAVIRFVDAFKDIQTRRVGFICRCNPTDSGAFDFIAFDPPSEEEEKAQKQRQNPN